MNRHQRAILLESSGVVLLTLGAILALVVFKDKTNQREALLAMEQLGREITAYRQQYGAVPPPGFVEAVRSSLQGNRRLGTLYYRARWIGLDAKDSEILAYTFKRYRSPLIDNGYVVLLLDGTVQWMTPGEFKILLDHQQSAEEKQTEPVPLSG